MAQNNPTPKPQNVDGTMEQTSGLLAKLQKNQKVIKWCVISLAVVVAAILVYIFAFRNPAIKRAEEAIGKADVALLSMAPGSDSLALAQYKNVADNMGYDAGNRAALDAAILLYQQGKYDEALKYLEKYKGKEKIIGSTYLSLMGDCYVNLDKYDKAIECYAKAIKVCDENPELAPVYMLKTATVERERKNYKAEADMLRRIKKEYPKFNAIDVDRYLKRAEVRSGASN